MVTLNTSLFCLHLFISNDLGKKKKCLAEFELISLEKKERRATLYPPHGHPRVRSFIIIFFILFETCSNLFTLFTQAETGSFWYQLVQFCNRIEPFVLLLQLSLLSLVSQLSLLLLLSAKSVLNFCYFRAKNIFLSLPSVFD